VVGVGGGEGAGGGKGEGEGMNNMDALMIAFLGIMALIIAGTYLVLGEIRKLKIMIIELLSEAGGDDDDDSGGEGIEADKS
jgi:hypothetical protein